MDKPPVISEPPARVIPLEVVTPGAPHSSSHSEKSPTTEKPAIHPLSAIALLAIDNLWNLEEWIVIDWFFTIPLSFISVFLPVFFIQKFLNKDSVGRALAYALLLGVVAAVPTSLTGTPVGLGLLAWSGLGKLFGKAEVKGEGKSYR